jgi:DNA polymerase (family 10)
MLARMRNPEIADAFTELADRLALTDTKPFRYMAYRTAASTFRELDESVAVLSGEGRLRDIDGIGPAIEEKVELLLATGSFPALDEARAQVDDTLLTLTRLPGIGPATAKKVFAALDGESFESMCERAAAGTLEVGGGVTRKVVEALATEAARRAAGGGDASEGDLSGVPRDDRGVPLPGPWFRRDQAASQIDALTTLLEPLGTTDVGGDYARGCELVTQLELLLTAQDPTATRAPLVELLAARGYELAPAADNEPLAFVGPSGMPGRMAVVDPAATERVREQLAGPPAWSTLVDEPGADTVPIELRDAVLAGRYTLDDAPRDLIVAADLRGELHAHSDWSDGRATILEMARAARDRGDSYWCVTDHSAPYALVGGLGDERLKAQAEEIARVNEQLATDHASGGVPEFRVLQGSEVEILADGTLGLPDAVLEQLDWVVASIHVAQRQSAADILERMRRVIDNPLVDAIGHPTSRRLLRRQRTSLDVDALIAMAVESDVVLEVNANPDRLDLDSTQAAQALAAGVRLTTNTDAHSIAHLDLRSHGVAVARRAGARPRDVVNCLPLDELLATRRRAR